EKRCNRLSRARCLQYPLDDDIDASNLRFRANDPRSLGRLRGRTVLKDVGEALLAKQDNRVGLIKPLLMQGVRRRRDRDEKKCDEDDHSSSLEYVDVVPKSHSSGCPTPRLVIAERPQLVTTIFVESRRGVLIEPILPVTDNSLSKKRATIFLTGCTAPALCPERIASHNLFEKRRLNLEASPLDDALEFGNRVGEHIFVPHPRNADTIGPVNHMGWPCKKRRFTPWAKQSA